MPYDQLCNLLAAGAAFIAAGLWLWASRATVKSDYLEPIPQDVKYLNFYGGRGPIQINNDGSRTDVTATLSRQARLNAVAAVVAAMAAALQGVALLVTSKG